MSFKAIVLCASALLVQTISANYLGGGYGAGLGRGCGCGGPAISGGGFPVQSGSPYPADGIAIRSDNAIDGCLDICGALPFLGAVQLGGEVPDQGGASVNYGCGNGAIDINQARGGAGLGAAGLGAGIGRAGCGCGYAGAY